MNLITRRIRSQIKHRVPEIAKKTGVSDQLLRQWLKGTMPRPEKLKLLAKATGKTVNWYMSGDRPTQNKDLDRLIATYEKVLSFPR